MVTVYRRPGAGNSHRLILQRVHACPYRVMMVVLGGFAVYQTVRFAEKHSAMLGLLTLFDLLFVWLTWRECREQRAPRAQAAPPPSL